MCLRNYAQSFASGFAGESKWAAALSDQEVVDRWQALFKGHVLVDRWESGESITAAELAVVDELIGTWRERLTDIMVRLRRRDV